MRICREGQDMKKSIILVMVLLLAGCAQAEKQEEGHSSTIVTSGGERFGVRGKYFSMFRPYAPNCE